MCTRANRCACAAAATRPLAAMWTDLRLRVASQVMDAIRTMVDNEVGSLVVQVSY